MLEVFDIPYLETFFIFHLDYFYIFLKRRKLKAVLPYLLFQHDDHVFNLFLNKYSSKIFIILLCKIKNTKSKSSSAVSVAGPSVTG